MKRQSPLSHFFHNLKRQSLHEFENLARARNLRTSGLIKIIVSIIFSSIISHRATARVDSQNYWIIFSDLQKFNRKFEIEKSEFHVFLSRFCMDIANLKCFWVFRISWIGCKQILCISKITRHVRFFQSGSITSKIQNCNRHLKRLWHKNHCTNLKSPKLSRARNFLISDLIIISIKFSSISF